MLQRSCIARVLESGCQLCCTCTLAMIAVDHFSDHFFAAVESQPSMHRLALCRRSVTGRGSSKAVHRPKDEENFSFSGRLRHVQQTIGVVFGFRTSTHRNATKYTE